MKLKWSTTENEKVKVIPKKIKLKACKKEAENLNLKNWIVKEKKDAKIRYKIPLKKVSNTKYKIRIANTCISNTTQVRLSYTI